MVHAMMQVRDRLCWRCEGWIRIVVDADIVGAVVVVVDGGAMMMMGVRMRKRRPAGGGAVFAMDSCMQLL